MCKATTCSRSLVGSAPIGIVGISIVTVGNSVPIAITVAPKRRCVMPTPAALRPARRLVYVAGAMPQVVATDPVMSPVAPIPIARHPEESDARREHGLIANRRRSHVDDQIDVRSRRGGECGSRKDCGDKASYDQLLHHGHLRTCLTPRAGAGMTKKGAAPLQRGGPDRSNKSTASYTNSFLAPRIVPGAIRFGIPSSTAIHALGLNVTINAQALLPDVAHSGVGVV